MKWNIDQRISAEDIDLVQNITAKVTQITGRVMKRFCSI